MVRALARAFQWRKMLDTGVHAALDDLAKAEGVAPSYVSRGLRLTLLAPEIVEAILDGRQPAEPQLDDLLEGFTLEWDAQRTKLARITHERSACQGDLGSAELFVIVGHGDTRRFRGAFGSSVLRPPFRAERGRSV
jgi:hypothetical protein